MRHRPLLAVLATLPLSACISGLTGDCTTTFEGHYRQRPAHKAIAHGVDGERCYWVDGRASEEAAKEAAMANCKKGGNAACTIVAVNGNYSGMTTDEVDETIETIVTGIGSGIPPTGGSRRRR